MELTSPIHVHWEMTNICNMKCMHCYQKSDLAQSILTEDELLLIAEKLIEAKIFQVTLTGGEPFAVKSLFQLVELFLKNKVNCLITSNGTLVTHEHAKWLSEHKVPVQISLDSHESDIHDKFRNYPGAHKKAVQAIQTLVENRVKTSIAFCASKINYQDLEGTIQLSADLRVNKVLVGEYLPLLGNYNSDTKDALEFSNGEYEAFISKALELKQKYKDVVDVQINTEWGFIINSHLDHSPCTALDRDMAILYSGNVSPCPFIRYGRYSSLGNLLTDSVYSIWNSETAKEFRSKKFLGCDSSCKHFAVCKSGCKAIYANLNEPIDSRDPRCLLLRT